MLQQIDYLALGPPVVLALTALTVLLADAFLSARPTPVLGVVTVAGLTVAVVAVGALAVTGRTRGTFCTPGPSPSCSYMVDRFTVAFQLVLLFAAIVVVGVARPEIRRTGLPAGEFDFLLLAALTGAVVLPAARDLVTLVVGLEVLSLPLFALVALRRSDRRSSEAALTMFLVSVASTAVMLFGVSLVYGVTGAVYLDRVARALPTQGPTVAVAAVGIIAVIVGFGFKIAAVPFHAWAPDTYQGAPVAVAAFLSVVSKAAGFAGLVLVLIVGFAPYATVWGPPIAVLAAASMTVGNLVALRQHSAVRLLAWSGVAQTGYMLAPLAAVAGVAGVSAPVVAATVAYVAIYAVVTVGAFTVVAHVGGGTLEDYRGLARSHPLLAAALAFFLAALAGLPPGIAGLFAKVVVVRAVLTGGYGWLAVLVVVNAVIALSYYLVWAARLFAAPDPLRTGGPRAAHARVSRTVGLAVAVAAAAAVVLSVVPQLVLGVAPLTGAG